MKIHCPRCNAGVGSLHPFVRPLKLGIKLQVVRCVICGWEISRPEPPEQLLSAMPAAPHELKGKNR